MDSEQQKQQTTTNAFVWRDHSRFVEVHPVRTGWLVVWGRYADFGAIRSTEGHTVYQTLAGAQCRVVDAALELTRSPRAASEASQMFDLFSFPEHSVELPTPI